MKTTRDHASADRYLYDFGRCSYKNGWAQVDTDQDASYFGTWCHPDRLSIFSYTEGDLCLLEAENADEFTAELRALHDWKVSKGYSGAKIDPGLNPVMIAKFEALGLANMLH